MFYVLYLMFYVLSSMFDVLCSTFYVLIINDNNPKRPHKSLNAVEKNEILQQDGNHRREHPLHQLISPRNVRKFSGQKRSQEEKVCYFRC